MDRKLGVLVGLIILIGALAAAILIARGGDPDLTDLDTRPTIEASSDPAPEKLEVEDIVEGDGAEAKEGDQVTVQYVGALYDTGEEFDASWNRGEAFPFTLGTGAVIPGWDQGVEGMKVGGRRKLTIPPDLGYGETGQGEDIPPNSTLVFIVDLEDVQPQAEGAEQAIEVPAQ